MPDVRHTVGLAPTNGDVSRVFASSERQATMSMDVNPLDVPQDLVKLCLGHTIDHEALRRCLPFVPCICFGICPEFRFSRCTLFSFCVCSVDTAIYRPHIRFASAFRAPSFSRKRLNRLNQHHQLIPTKMSSEESPLNGEEMRMTPTQRLSGFVIV